MSSSFLKHLPCEACGSSNGAALYDDYHTHCFVCGVTAGGSSEGITSHSKPKRTAMEIKGEIKSIPDRGITRSTCTKYEVIQDEISHYYPYTYGPSATIASQV